MAKKEDLSKEDSYAFAMLDFIPIQHPDQIQNLLQTFNPEKQTWIVSDLKSKQEIQNDSVQKYGFYVDDSILRVSDFWKIWIRRLEPTLQVVSSDFIKTLVQLFIDIHGSQIEIAENDFSTLNRYVQELAPIILHPESDQILKEWLQQQEETKKWALWYSKARLCLLFIVNEKKVIDTKWSAAYLQTIDLEQVQWPLELIVDLGSELTSIEMGLFKNLSQKQKVQVYAPSPSWIKNYPFLFKTYTENYGFGILKEISSTSLVKPPILNKTEFVRLSTQLAEVKFAVAQTRKWLDQGIQLQQIALIGLQVEDYWCALEFYLNEEGIPAQKDVVAPINSLAAVQIFLSHLKSLTSDVSFESLQQKLYQHQNQVELKYEKFKALFSQLYHDEDLARDSNIKNIFYRKLDLVSEMNRDEFLIFLVKVWIDLPESHLSSELFEIIFKDILSQSLETPMKFNRWYQFLKARISRKEIKVKNSDVKGIQVLSLMSSQMAQADYRIYFGLFDEAFRNSQKSMLPLSDIEVLKNQFDFAIEYPEESHLDFNLRWIAETSVQQQFMLTPHLSFSAEPLTACSYFLQNQPQSEIIRPEPTRLDQLQTFLAQNHFEKNDVYEATASLKRINEDLLGAELKFSSDIFNQLSASDVENYAQCSFKLFASKGFRLRDYPETAIDLDPRQKGTLVHALFEHAILQIEKNSFSLEQMKEFLDQKRIEFSLFPNEDAFWTVQRSKMLNVVKKFYEFEKQRVQQFKSLTEINFELFFDFENEILTKKPSSNAISIKGRIDRLDQHKDQKYFLIYDYKSSAANIEPYAKWLTKYKFQLLIYTLAVEISLFDKADVKGALFYLYKNFDLTKGYVQKEVGVHDLQLSAKLKCFLDDDDQDQLKSDFILFLAQMFKKLQQGYFKAQPNDLEICDECDWRKLCRARHLM